MSTEHVTAPASAARPAAWAYGWWVVVGALLGLGLVSILSIGAAFLLAGSVLAVVGIRLAALRNHSAFAAPAGVGLVALWLAWLNRGGPGQVCETTSTETSCAEAWSPWPFLAVAVLLVAAAVVLVRLARR